MDKNELVEEKKHMDYAKALAQHYYCFVPDEKRGLVKIEDLVSAGYEGLVMAAEKFRSGSGATFKTYSTKWIKGMIIRELIFYIGKDALLLGDDEEKILKAYARMVADQTVDPEHDRFDISGIPEEEKVKIITSKLAEYKLTEDEISVYLAVNGIGCSKVTNLSALARKLKKMEIEIRRLKQSAEDKMKVLAD